MYIAQAAGGRFRIVENLGVIEPQEAQVQSAERPSAAGARARAAV